MSSHPAADRLHKFIKNLGLEQFEKEYSWLSVYLGGDDRIPRIYTTRAPDQAPSWWLEQNGLIVDEGWRGLQNLGRPGSYIESRSGAPGGFEVVRELAIPYLSNRTGLRAAVMFETYEPDAFQGAWGSVEARGARGVANSIVSYLGFGDKGSAPEIVLPDRQLVSEDFDSTAITLVSEISEELLARLSKKPEEIHSLTSREFEKLIARLLVDLGYEIWLTPATKDRGRDILAVSRQPLGTFLTLVECKKWRPDRPVPVEVVRGIYGVMQQERATHALLATTSRFTKPALEFRDAVRYHLSLRDFVGVTEWLAKYS